MTDGLNFFAPISKSDEETRMVYGYASTEALDSQGEIVKKDALADAINDYMVFANIREMHQPSAVGKAKKAQLDNKGLYIAAKVVDDEAWAKVKEGVYSGFSIGGKVKTMVGNEIQSLTLSEISLVDRPANPECKIDVFKRDVSTEERESLAEEGKAMPDGSYPIANVSDLKNAIQSFGRAKNKTAVKKHIIARAKALKATDLLPADWSGSTKEEKSETPEMEKISPMETQMADNCIARLVAYNGSLQIAHWKANTVTNEHKALGDLYGAMVELVDDFAEVFMGKYGVMANEMPTVVMDITADPVEEGLKLVADLQTHFTVGVDDDLINLLADMSTALNKAKYLLKENVPSNENTVVLLAEKTDNLAKIEEGLRNGKMPTDSQISELLKSRELPETQEVINKLKWEMSGKIVDYMKDKINKAQDEGIKEEVKEEVVVETPVETPAETVETPVVEEVKEEVVTEEKPAEVVEEVVEEKSEKTEDLEKVGRSISMANASKISSALASIQTAVAQLAEMVNGNLTENDKSLIGDKGDHKAGSTMWSGDHVSNPPTPDVALPPLNNAEQITDLVKAEVGKEDADLAKVAGALAQLKEQVQKMANTPMPIKAVASYVTVEKFGSTPNEDLVKAEKRSKELQQLLKGPMANDLTLRKEANELSDRIMQLRRIAK